MEHEIEFTDLSPLNDRTLRVDTSGLTVAPEGHHALPSRSPSTRAPVAQGTAGVSTAAAGRDYPEADGEAVLRRESKPRAGSKGSPLL